MLRLDEMLARHIARHDDELAELTRGEGSGRKGWMRMAELAYEFFMRQTFYTEAYNELAVLGAAPMAERDGFVHAFMAGDGTKEWRFQGFFGFGGKFWRQDGRHYVTYYPEDQTEPLDALMAEINQQLDKLAEEYLS